MLLIIAIFFGALSLAQLGVIKADFNQLDNLRRILRKTRDERNALQDEVNSLRYQLSQYDASRLSPAIVEALRPHRFTRQDLREDGGQESRR